MSSVWGSRRKCCAAIGACKNYNQYDDDQPKSEAPEGIVNLCSGRTGMTSTFSVLNQLARKSSVGLVYDVINIFFEEGARWRSISSMKRHVAFDTLGKHEQGLCNPD